MLFAGCLLGVALAAAQPRLAVLEVKARLGVSPALAQGLTDDLTLEVRRRNPGTLVIGMEDIQSMLEVHQQRLRAGCQDLGCLAEIGGALGADRLVNATLGRFGQTYLLVVQLVDVRGARVLREGSEKLKGKDEDALLEAISKIVGSLFLEPVVASTRAAKAQATGGPEALPPLSNETLTASAAPPPHATWPRWLFAGGAAATGGLAIYGATVVARFTSESASLKAGHVPAGLTFPSYQGDQSKANTWGTASLLLTGLALGCVAGGVLTW